MYRRCLLAKPERPAQYLVDLVQLLLDLFALLALLFQACEEDIQVESVFYGLRTTSLRVSGGMASSCAAGSSPRSMNARLRESVGLTSSGVVAMP